MLSDIPAHCAPDEFMLQGIGVKGQERRRLGMQLQRFVCASFLHEPAGIDPGSEVPGDIDHILSVSIDVCDGREVIKNFQRVARVSTSEAGAPQDVEFIRPARHNGVETQVSAGYS